MDLRRGRTRSIRVLLLAAALPAAVLSAGEPSRAEYAVRWDPKEGGPATVGEALSFLGAPETAGRAFTVRYFDFPKPASAPPDSIAILRQRAREDGKAEIRLKYRRTQPLTGTWACPEAARFRKAEEVDVSFGSSGPPARVYAYACTLVAKAPPAFLGAAPRPCAARMVRYEVGGDKLEEWTLPDGVRLEVSRSAPNTPDELAKFGELVERLRARGVRPLAESKSELGSRCPEAGGAPAPAPGP